MTVSPLRSRRLQNLNLTTSAAGTYVSDETSVPIGILNFTSQAVFVRGSGGTTCDVFIQTSLDQGSTWIDIIQFAFVTTTVTGISAVKPNIALAANYTPTDGALSDNSITDGLMGDRVRVKTVIAGTYSGTSTLDVRVIFN
tara:strand:- start:7692 stop:8114 length:423 start_codon:yes stop_codon:yes gene_type:complete